MDILGMFWSHTKQHSSKTNTNSSLPNVGFWSHTKQHSSKTTKIFSDIV